MIKINLNRSRVDGGEEGTSVQVSAVELNGRDLLVKFVIMFIGVIAFTLYEKQNIDQLDVQLAGVQAQATKTQEELNHKKAELTSLKDIEPQSQALADKLKVLHELSKLRLFQMQSLDFIQSVIPEKVWLQSVNYERSAFRMLGYAVETTDLTDFVHRLENSAYFQDVIVVQDREKAVSGGKIRDFELTSRSEVKN